MIRSNKCSAKIFIALFIGALLTTSLSSCFMIPTLDGRSPFDDPWGASRSDISAGIPVLQEALDAIEPGSDWELVAGSASDNCEGACSLRLRAQIIPSDELIDRTREELLVADVPADGYEQSYTVVDIPYELWRSVASTSIRTSEQLGLDVTVDSDFAEIGVVRGELRALYPTECEAVQQHLGSFSERSSFYDERFRASLERDDTACVVDFYSSKRANLTEDFGL